MFMFMGSLQFALSDTLCKLSGVYMIFVGVVAITIGCRAARRLKLLKNSLKSDDALIEAFHTADKDGNGTLDYRELLSFIHSSGVEMNRAELTAAFLALDKNFDDKITYEELFEWWSGESES